MDSFRGLVEGDCEGANPLLQMKSHFKNDSYNSAVRNLLSDSSASLNMELPFVTAPSTFDMETLLTEIKQLDDKVVKCQPHIQTIPITSLPAQHSLLADKWLQEIEDEKQATIMHILPKIHKQWTTDSLINNEIFLNHDFGNFTMGFLPSYHDPVSGQEPSDWLEGFINKERQINSKFLDMENNYETEDQEISNVMKNENQDEAYKIDYKVAGDTPFWEIAEKEWYKIEKSSWEQGFPNDIHRTKDYVFQRENPVKEYPDALQEGIRRLEMGDVSNAVLFLEAAVQKEPTNSEAWFYLGRSQADNEQEISAINAFEKCLVLDTNNLEALTSLAVCYTNEGHSHKAIKTLFRWLKSNPRYSKITSSFEDFAVPHNAIIDHDNLVGIFLEAARISPVEIDPDLQDALGVLFNISCEYDKAIDCFKTALQIQPENSMLWNKLGATLANGNRSEEALEAYRRALSLRPGYVRTRFNLGVACYNLKAYRESVEHYLSALNLQKNSQGPSETSSFTNSHMSESIWSSLKLSLTLLGATNLLPACITQQLEVLNKEFNMT